MRLFVYAAHNANTEALLFYFAIMQLAATNNSYLVVIK